MAVFMLLLVVASTSAHAVSIELKGAAPDRIERQTKAATGRLPLPGTPNISQREARLKQKDLETGAPILIRIFKEESELEVWMRRGPVFVHFATYPVCNWSGGLGPKLKEGDKQAPEGFYTVTRRRLRRSGRWPQSLNLGFPNILDRTLDRTGSYILVHGGCTSTGCFAMTNPVIDEIYDLTKAAIKAGQKHVPIHVLPFHLTDKNLKRHTGSKWFDFWKNLKQGYDSFERTHLPPQINVCQDRYHIRDGDHQQSGVEPQNVDLKQNKKKLQSTHDIVRRCEPSPPAKNAFRKSDENPKTPNTSKRTAIVPSQPKKSL